MIRSNRALPYTLTQLRDLVAERLAGKECPYCRAPLTAENFSLGHERPISRGGSWAMENLVVCCRRCNDAKGSMTGSEWLILLELMGECVLVQREQELRLRECSEVLGTTMLLN